MKPTRDLHIAEFQPLMQASDLLQEEPLTERTAGLVFRSRGEIENILKGKDPRLMVVAGPCSIHDEKSALEYAERLAELNAEVQDKLYLVMRVYFEKPRTTVGWKGYIYDPHLNGSYDISTGLRRARRILHSVLELGLPTATEFLDPIVPQFIADLVSWAAIGARTTESQTHRQMASGLSMPTGFKNNTDGNIQVAVDAIESARHPHNFLGIDEHGRACIVRTKGNDCVHIILRGGRDKSNYDEESVRAASVALAKNPRGIQSIVVDCSHANSGKQHGKQAVSFRSIVEQRLAGNPALTGVMLESHLKAGNQKITADPAGLEYGVSITDACMDFPATAELIREAAAKL